MKYYRLLSALPALPLAPEKPPIALSEVISQLRQELAPADLRLAEAMAMVVDMGNLENLLASRDAPFDAGGLYAKDQLSSKLGTDLPEFASLLLQKSEEGGLSPAAAIAALWQAYYGYLLEVAETSGCRFLKEYVAFELPLRNALYRLRAEKLGLDTAIQRLDEPSGGVPHDDLISALAEEPDAITRERLLDTARLRAFEAVSGIDPFSIEAVLCYLASTLVLDRWDLPRTADAKQLLEVFA
ncbi:MAG: DUF2764 domain-containing protein [Myxococcota bacterium]|nr:DUF2764 domain-containing protein [Myxococcota bacterium]